MGFDYLGTSRDYEETRDFFAVIMHITIGPIHFTY
jgi:hypothetical protein